MAQGRSTNIILMIKWIRTSRLSIKKSLSAGRGVGPGEPNRHPSGPRGAHGNVNPIPKTSNQKVKELLIDNLLVRILFIIVMVRWTGLAPWEFEFPFPGSLISTFLVNRHSGRPGGVHGTVNPILLLYYSRA